MKNSSIDLFNSISEKLETQEWELFTSEIIKMNYQVTLNQLSQMVENFTNETLTKQQLSFIYESFRTNRNDHNEN